MCQSKDYLRIAIIGLGQSYHNRLAPNGYCHAWEQKRMSNTHNKPPACTAGGLLSFLLRAGVALFSAKSLLAFDQRIKSQSDPSQFPDLAHPTAEQC